jgi:spore coat protein CotH
MKKIFSLLLSISLVAVTYVSCRKEPLVPVDNTLTPQSYNPDWTEATHGNVAPDYSVVFPQNSVNRLEITLGADKWAAIRANMTALFGFDFGAGGAGPFPSQETSYVDCSLKFNGKVWKNVGFRLKGNSTLSSAWRNGIYKLPFRLNFDEFEELYPGILNQHFYGFEELSFSPGIKDASLMREKITADLFRNAGIPAAQTAFYAVYVDIGTGLKYWGLYCGIELPDDNMIKSQFGEESGNLYKPESKFGSFVMSEFEKKNNEIAADYSDVQAFVQALTSPNRTTNPALWRQNLESVFNMDHFLKWLAVNNTLVNWDTYGLMAHNYYLYNHSINKLTWIPWDNNEALTRSPGITGTVGAPSPGGSNALSLTMNEVSGSWPLIRYVADDAVYFQRYKDLLKDYKNNNFNVAAIQGMIDNYYNLISPYVIGTNGEQPGYTHLASSAAFTNEKTNLKTHIQNRWTLVNSFVP